MAESMSDKWLREMLKDRSVKVKPKKVAPPSKAAKCFLFSEELSSAVNAAAVAHNEAIHLTSHASTRRLHDAIYHAKLSLATIAGVQDPIGRKAKSIVRELTKESTIVSVGGVPMKDRHKRFSKAMDKVFYDIATLKSESARKCGVIRYDELSAQGAELFRDFEERAKAELKLPPADITAWEGPKLFKNSRG